MEPGELLINPKPCPCFPLRRLVLRLAPLLFAGLAGACATEADRPYDYYGDPYAPYPYWSLYDDPFFWPYGWDAYYCYYCGPYYGPYFGYTTVYAYYPGRYPVFPHPGPGWGRRPLNGTPQPRPPVARPVAAPLGGSFRPAPQALPRTLSRPLPRPQPLSRLRHQ